MYLFPSTVVIDPVSGALAKNVDGKVYSGEGPGSADALVVTLTDGQQRDVVRTGLVGLTESFYADEPTLEWRSGDLVVPLFSFPALIQLFQEAASSSASAVALAEGLSALLGQKNRVWPPSATAPAEGVTVGDLWIDESDARALKRWNGSIWELVQDFDGVATEMLDGIRAQIDQANEGLEILATETLPQLRADLETLGDVTIPGLAETIETLETVTLPGLAERLQEAETDLGVALTGTVATDRLVANEVAAAIGTFLEINAGNIDAESVAAAVGTFLEISADQITAGTIDTARLNVTTLAASIASVITLNADRITAGFIATERLDVQDIAGQAAEFIELQASQITAGTIATARLDAVSVAAAVGSFLSLNADQLTAGIISADRLILSGGTNIAVDSQFTKAAVWGNYAGLNSSGGRTPSGRTLQFPQSATQVIIRQSFNHPQTVVENQRYKLSAWVYFVGAAPTAAARLNVDVSWFSNTWTSFGVGLANPAGIPANTWVYMEAEITAPGTATKMVAQVRKTAAHTTGIIRVTDLVIQAKSDASLVVNGAIDGKTVTGALIQTVATPNRGIKLTSAGLEGFSNTGVRGFYLNPTTGTVEAVGGLRTALTGNRVEIYTQTGTPSGNVGTVDFWTSEIAGDGKASLTATSANDGSTGNAREWADNKFTMTLDEPDGMTSIRNLGMSLVARFYRNGSGDQIAYHEAILEGSDVRLRADVVWFAGEPHLYSSTLAGIQALGVEYVPRIQSAAGGGYGGAIYAHVSGSSGPFSDAGDYIWSDGAWVSKQPAMINWTNVTPVTGWAAASGRAVPKVGNIGGGEARVRAGRLQRSSALTLAAGGNYNIGTVPPSLAPSSGAHWVGATLSVAGTAVSPVSVFIQPDGAVIMRATAAGSMTTSGYVALHGGTTFPLTD